MNRRLSYTRMAFLKSQVNALRMVERLLRAGSISAPDAARELERIQVNLFQLSKTPKGSVL